MKLTILTLFPDFFSSPLASSILKRAIEAKIVEVAVIDIRQFATDKHRVTDDRPFGGGPGMVMKVEPIDRALKSLGKNKNTSGQMIALTSAKGKKFTQAIAQEWAALDELILICGHYEGVDERVAENLIDTEIRIGDFVLTGGEPAALVLVDAVTRLLPGALGNESSPQNESHSQAGVGGFPQYTRPEEYSQWTVPSVLLSGDHQKIQEWREQHKSELD